MSNRQIIANDETKSELINFIITGLFFAVTDFFVQYIFPNWPSGATTIISFVILFLLVKLNWSPIKKLTKNKPSVVIVLVVTFGLFILFNNYLFTVLRERRTAYFIIDMSEQMAGSMDQVAPRAKLRAEQIPNRVDIALATIGGKLSDNLGCNDIYQFVEPGDKEDNLVKTNKIIDTLIGIEPTGNAGIQEGILFAINHLRWRRGIHEIIVITNGKIDPSCAEINEVYIFNYAKERGVRFEVTFITLGDITEEEAAIFEGYRSFNHIAVGGVTTLAGAIEEAISSPPSRYWYSYLLTE